MPVIKNPILKGFNPDPSILRVGDDYYIATSTFEWFPGVQIHHSRDLVNWQLLCRPLDRESQLDMLGNPDSGGIWAPCLSYSDGLFYLIYTDVKSHIGPFKDTHNYLVTAENIEGPWSESVYLNSSGFDPSLFHDEDGRKWLLNMVWDHRKGKNKFGGTLMQEYDPDQKCLTGPVYNIYRGTNLGLTEGPHIYKRNGYYYLIVAEGGTRYDHAVTVARSRSLFGPYETDPDYPLLTAAGKPDLPLQRAGHASLVETAAGEWYLAYLCGRPLRPMMRCTLGRETALQKVEWSEDDWLKLSAGGHDPEIESPAPDLPSYPFKPAPAKDTFDSDELNIHFQTLKIPPSEAWLSLKARSGFLRIIGRESFSSMHRQSLIARRLQAFNAQVETLIEFEPDNYQQMAGLVCYYNTKNYLYLYVTWDEQLGKCLNIMISDLGIYNEPLDQPIAIKDMHRILLKADIAGDKLQFLYAEDNADPKWIKAGPVLDFSKLSDEYAESKIGPYLLDQGFTGAYVGLCVQDLSGSQKYADFDHFSYIESV